MVRSRKVVQTVILILVSLPCIYLIALFFPAEYSFFWNGNDFMNTAEWSCENGGTTLQTYDASLCLGDRNIFFIESSSSGVLNARQACAVESAARHNPNFDVQVLIMSPEASVNRSDFKGILKSISNVKLHRIEYEVVIFGTPLWSWYKTGSWSKSYHKVLHLSDALRMLLVWKYGGIYLDLDMVVLRSLEMLFNATVSDNGINSSNAVLIFAKKHPFLKRCIMDFAAHYKYTEFAENGPVLITRNLKEFCNVQDLTKTADAPCRIKFFPVEAACPIPYEKWETFFKPPQNDSSTDFNNSYMIHLWNKMSSQRKVIIGEGSVYELAMKKNCPTVYAQASVLGYA